MPLKEIKISHTHSLRSLIVAEIMQRIKTVKLLIVFIITAIKKLINTRIESIIIITMVVVADLEAEMIIY